MTGGRGGSSPPDGALAADEAFSLVGDGTRIAILRTLWEHTKDVGMRPGSALPFSELMERTGVDDSGNFNYHLDRLVGHFVERTDEGYRIRRAGVFVVRSILAGTVTADPSFGPTDVGVSCYRCGGRVLVEYENERVMTRCTACEGVFGAHDYPPGTITALTYPPAALRGRDREEVFLAAHRRYLHGVWAMLDGICPACTGTVTLDVRLCPAHDDGGGTLCEECGTAIFAPVSGVCDVCACYRVFPAAFALLPSPAVDVSLSGPPAECGFPRPFVEYETWESRLRSRDPIRIEYVVPDGDGTVAAVVDGNLDIVEP